MVSVKTSSNEIQSNQQSLWFMWRRCLRLSVLCGCNHKSCCSEYAATRSGVAMESVLHTAGPLSSRKPSTGDDGGICFARFPETHGRWRPSQDEETLGWKIRDVYSCGKPYKLSPKSALSWVWTIPKWGLALASPQTISLDQLSIFLVTW